MDREPLKGIVAGAIGGLVASYVMNYTHQAWSKAEELVSGDGKNETQQDGSDAESEIDREEENDPATIKVARMVSERVFHHELTDQEKRIVAPAVHYGFGTAMGAVYGGLAELAPATSAGVGLPFGAALWAMADEVVVPALGASKKPTEYPPATHAEALASHLVYGLTTDLVRRALRNVM